MPKRCVYACMQTTYTTLVELDQFFHIQFPLHYHGGMHQPCVKIFHEQYKEEWLIHLDYEPQIEKWLQWTHIF